MNADGAITPPNCGRCLCWNCGIGDSSTLRLRWCCRGSLKFIFHRWSLDMTNVLHIIDSFEQGGTERQAVQLVRLLHETGQCRVQLAVLQNKGALRAEAERLGVGEIHEYPLTSFYDRNFTTQAWRLVRFLKA